MARCPDCNKFVSYDESTEPEVSSEEIDDDGQLTAEVRVVLACAECGGELKEANLTFEASVQHECEKDAEVLPDWNEGDDKLSIDSIEAEFQSRQQDTDAKGKPIKNPRYMKTFYGACVTANVKCNRCGEEVEVNGCVDEQDSAFDDLV